MAAQDPIAVPRWLLFGGVVGFGASLLAVAFLAGRASNEATSALPIGATPMSEPAVPPSAVPATAAPAPPPSARPEPAPPVAMVAQPPSPAPAAPAPADPSSGAVVAYLDALETALETPNAGADPDELAQAVVADALSGRTQAIDQLLVATEGARGGGRGAPPPRTPAPPHPATLTLLDQTLRVYGALRSSIASGDIAGIAGLQTDANKLERAARDVEAETRRLREAHGG